jgi:dTDP-4-amino-4,6-dideoxygalactose transaminase
MDSWNLPTRKKNGNLLIKALKDHPLVLEVPFDSEERQNSFWWAPFVLDIDKLKVPMEQFIAAMSAEGVYVFGPLWPELYNEKVLREKRGYGRLNQPFNAPNASKIDYTKVECKNAKWLAERTISFFAHPVYDHCHIDQYIEAFNKVADCYMK